MKSPKMRCFVATAFGRNDVDQIYSQCIKPLLKELGIAAYRVDQVVHNDDIDEKIIELLDKAHFCIADLTYARPSVYFEAGYAITKKPVIFTARRDHFTARDSDPEGNLRVHFDLQMKNIIGWGSSRRAFTAALRKRILHVTAPVRRELARNDKRDAERRAFSALSPLDRLAAIRNEAEKFLQSRRFRTEPHGAHSLIAQGYLKGARIFVSALNRATFTFRDLQSVRIDYSMGLKLTGFKQLTSRSAVRNLTALTVLSSLGPIPESKLQRAFSSHASSVDGVLVSSYDKDGVRIQSIITPLGRIQSLPEFTESFARALDYSFSLGEKGQDEGQTSSPRLRASVISSPSGS